MYSDRWFSSACPVSPSHSHLCGHPLLPRGHGQPHRRLLPNWGGPQGATWVIEGKVGYLTRVLILSVIKGMVVHGYEKAPAEISTRKAPYARRSADTDSMCSSCGLIRDETGYVIGQEHWVTKRIYVKTRDIVEKSSSWWTHRCYHTD